MTLKHMQVYVTVYQEMNITHAAKKLHMTQPAVTRSIHELESYYGTALFERINHKLYKTESGNELYAHAVHILDSFDTMETTMMHWEVNGVLHIGGNTTLGTFLLPKLLSKFQEQYPKLRVRVTIANSFLLQESLLNNKIDIAIMEGGPSSEYLNSDFLTETKLSLILPKNHPLTQKKEILLKDLLAYPLLLRESGSANRTFLDYIFAMHGLSFVPAWESSSTHAIIAGVKNGLGISILPKPLIAAELIAGKIVTRTVSDESFATENYIVWHKQKFLTKSAKDFLLLCHNMIAQDSENFSSIVEMQP